MATRPASENLKPPGGTKNMWVRNSAAAIGSERKQGSVYQSLVTQLGTSQFNTVVNGQWNSPHGIVFKFLSHGYFIGKPPEITG